MADFQQARTILFGLRDDQQQDPAKLVGDMDTAEGVYGDDLAADAAGVRALALLDGRRAGRADELAVLVRTQPARTGGAVRGDG
jgi:hypothetical protein